MNAKYLLTIVLALTCSQSCWAQLARPTKNIPSHINTSSGFTRNGATIMPDAGGEGILTQWGSAGVPSRFYIMPGEDVFGEVNGALKVFNGKFYNDDGSINFDYQDIGIIAEQDGGPYGTGVMAINSKANSSGIYRNTIAPLQFQFNDGGAANSLGIRIDYVPYNYHVNTAGVWRTDRTFAAGEKCHYAGIVYSTASGGPTGTIPPVHTSGTASDGSITDWLFEKDMASSFRSVSVWGEQDQKSPLHDGFLGSFHAKDIGQLEGYSFNFYDLPAADQPPSVTTRKIEGNATDGIDIVSGSTTLTVSSTAIEQKSPVINTSSTSTPRIEVTAGNIPTDNLVSVVGKSYLRINMSSGTVINGFTGGLPGQRVTVECVRNTTFTDQATQASGNDQFRLPGEVDLLVTADVNTNRAVIEFILTDTWGWIAIGQ